MRQVRAAIIAALFIPGALLASGLGTAAAAQDVTLRSRDGGIELNGTMLGFDGEFYRIDSRYGELTVDSSGVLCEGVGCPSLTDFVAEMRISGAATMGDLLMPALIESFVQRNDYTVTRSTLAEGGTRFTLSDPERVIGRFDVAPSSTDEGFADLLADEADIAIALRAIRPTEQELARAAGLGDLSEPNRSRVLALDALIPVVAPDNPVGAVTLPDLAHVLSGEIDNWQALGGPDAPIVLHLPPEGSGLVQALEDRLLQPPSLSLRSAETKRHATAPELAEAVTGDPLGLGFISAAEVGNARPLVLTGSCGFHLRGTRQAIKTEDYPLTMPVFVYLPARRLPKLAREFLEFTRSAPAQIVIRRAGFVDQAPEELPLDAQGDRLANAVQVAEGEEGLGELKRLVTTLAPMRRLTTSFRFEPNSARLDAQSRSNVQQLARALELGDYDGRTLVFVGFSDGQGPAAGNLEIAAERAASVRDAVRSAAEATDLAGITLETDAFGEAMPMACDETVWGRQVNRRVEVWLR
ncbi:phosphate ABC transporter substrate-binding/OmpA family protein [Alloyangia pacifica]|uniref:phosphate ABC transporter substrate-binding/OmpA family protein n=1 Tax=Alloyangia pacifica TaxID=311180 RepID=UPI001CD77A39|nr:phosphate ABC transporter substrate-binding/OmpA family protein [Alloyangia pacifica]MCA0996006.1 substrate-binding domain-containing protein [Alloyangia pacifica]